MKKIFILSLVLTIATVTVSAQQNRGEFNRNRIERGFNRENNVRGERFRSERNGLRYRMAQRRLHRYAFVRPRGRGERRMMVRNRFNRGRMFLRGHYYNGRRVI